MVSPKVCIVIIAPDRTRSTLRVPCKYHGLTQHLVDMMVNYYGQRSEINSLYVAHRIAAIIEEREERAASQQRSILAIVDLDRGQYVTGWADEKTWTRAGFL